MTSNKINYKEFLFEVLDRMSFIDLVKYYNEVRGDTKKSIIIGKYLGETHNVDMNKGYDSCLDKLIDSYNEK